MKRDILCKSCEEIYRKLFPVDSPYPGEHVKFVCGEAKKKMICDYCAIPIKKGDNCCAFSGYTDNRPYSKWEDDFINQTMNNLIKNISQIRKELK